MRTQRARKKAIIAICTFLVAGLMFGMATAHADDESEIVKMLFPDIQKKLNEQNLTYEQAKQQGSKAMALNRRLVPYEEATKNLKEHAERMPKPVDVEALLKNAKNQKNEADAKK